MTIFSLFGASQHLPVGLHLVTEAQGVIEVWPCQLAQQSSCCTVLQGMTVGLVDQPCRQGLHQQEMAHSSHHASWHPSLGASSSTKRLSRDCCYHCKETVTRQAPLPGGGAPELETRHQSWCLDMNGPRGSLSGQKTVISPQGALSALLETPEAFYMMSSPNVPQAGLDKEVE